MCGAFSDKWFDVSKRCGKQAEALQVDWGSPIRAEADGRKTRHRPVRRAHPHPQRNFHRRDEPARGNRRAQEKISRRHVHRGRRQFDERGANLKFDELGIDVLLAGTQKAFALPPGTAVFVCSPAALAKAATAKDRGYYFDFVEFQKNAEQSMTPSTPSIGHVYALALQAGRIFRRRPGSPLRPPQKDQPDDPRLGGQTRLHAVSRKKALNRVTLTCVNNGAKPGGRTVDVAKLQKLVKDQGFLIDGGYGKIKGTTFRISNMGDETEATMNQLYAALDKAMAQL